MSSYRKHLPQLDGGLFLTDGGLETTLVFHDKVELPHFAAIDQMRTPEGAALLRAYFERYLAIAAAHGTGFVLESQTWRASPDWGGKLGYAPGELARLNRASIEQLVDLRRAHAGRVRPIVISGCIGPRGDGYDPGAIMSAEEAQAYHSMQASLFAGTQADMISAITMTNANEAVGITRAARAVGMPVAISFTVETDGRLPTGQSLRAAIEEVDAATGAAPAYYMVNCAHPTHFASVLAGDAGWMQRVRGLRANASRRSHAELNESPDLDDGNPLELGQQYRDLLRANPQINVLGGCCGTDHRHIEAICGACLKAA